MAIVLTRTVELQVYDVVMELGRAEDRRDVIAVLMRTAELSGRITPEEVCRSFFPERPVALGKNVLGRCAELGVLDGEGRITDLGREALEKRRVFQPERGRYQVVCTLDPLIPQRILTLESVHEPRVDQTVGERRLARSKAKETAPPRSDVELPDWLKATEHHTLNLVDSGKEVAILSVEPRCLRMPSQGGFALRVRWELSAEDDPVLRLEGSVDRVLEAPQVSHDGVLTELLTNAGRTWDPEVGVMRCTFEELTDAQRASFSGALELESPVLQAYGRFSPTEISDLPVAPSGPGEAQRWAEWLLDHSITAYMTDREYEALSGQIVQRFPEFRVRLPTRQQKEAALRESVDPLRDRMPRAYWFLRAPHDLEMPEAPP